MAREFLVQVVEQIDQLRVRKLLNHLTTSDEEKCPESKSKVLRTIFHIHC